MDLAKEKRRKIVEELIKRNPNCIPVIITSSSIKFKATKYIVPEEMTLGRFLSRLKTHAHDLDAYHSIYLLINNVLPTMTNNMSVLHHIYKDDCGFLNITAEMENTFGLQNHKNEM